MKVETFEQTESETTEIAAHDAASLEIIERLGLNGQKAQSSTETGQRNPYRQMTKDEEFVYRILCPEKSKPEEYSAGMIPLRVLQVLAWAKDSGIYKRFEIWAAESATVKDPVLVGYCPNHSRSWQDDIYILARWGQELLPIEVLFPDAFVRWHTKRKAQLAAMMSKLRAEVEAHASNNEAHIPASIEEPYIELRNT